MCIIFCSIIHYLQLYLQAYSVHHTWGLVHDINRCLAIAHYIQSRFSVSYDKQLIKLASNYSTAEHRKHFEISSNVQILLRLQPK